MTCRGAGGGRAQCVPLWCHHLAAIAGGLTRRLALAAELRVSSSVERPNNRAQHNIQSYLQVGFIGQTLVRLKGFDREATLGLRDKKRGPSSATNTRAGGSVGVATMNNSTHIFGFSQASALVDGGSSPRHRKEPCHGTESVRW